MESKYLYRPVSFIDLLWRAAPLIEAHTSLHGSTPQAYLSQGLDKWVQLEAEGRIVLTEAVEAATDATVGYVLWGFDVHPFFPGQRVAKLGPWYVDKPHRKLASRQLFNTSLELLRELGCRYALPTLPIRHRGLRKRQHLFGQPIETTFLLDLALPEQPAPVERAAEAEGGPVGTPPAEAEPKSDDRDYEQALLHQLLLLSGGEVAEQPAEAYVAEPDQERPERFLISSGPAENECHDKRQDQDDQVVRQLILLSREGRTVARAAQEVPFSNV